MNDEQPQGSTINEEVIKDKAEELNRDDLVSRAMRRHPERFKKADPKEFPKDAKAMMKLLTEMQTAFEMAMNRLTQIGKSNPEYKRRLDDVLINYRGVINFTAIFIEQQEKQNKTVKL